MFKVLPKTSFTTSMLAHKWHRWWLGGLLDRRHGWTGVGWPILSIHNQLHAVQMNTPLAPSNNNMWPFLAQAFLRSNYISLDVCLEKKHEFACSHGFVQDQKD